MLQFEELKLALDELKPDLSDLEEALDLKAAGEEIEKLEKEYVRRIKNFKIVIKENNLSAEEANKRTEALQQEFRDEAIKICSNKWQLMNIVLDLCYGKNKNKYFCWAVIGDLIIEKLKEDGEKENE